MALQQVKPRRSLFTRLGDVYLGLVGPSCQPIPMAFANVCPDKQLYEQFVCEIQRFRGGIYLEDGTIPPSAVDCQGRHFTLADYSSWHLILLNQRIEVVGCARACLHTGVCRVSDLKLAEMMSRMEMEQRQPYEAAVQVFLDQAREAGRTVIEAGGLAVSKSLRNSASGPVLALACSSLGRLLGNSVMIGTAGRCNHSANILRRLGWAPLTHKGAELDAFYDAHHGCAIELLGFDCHSVPGDYERTVEEIKAYLQDALIWIPSGRSTVYAAARTRRELLLSSDSNLV